MRSLVDAAPSPLLCCESISQVGLPPDVLSISLDDVSVAYVLAARPAFDGLRQAAGQLAGVLVLAASGGRSAPGHPMISLADSVWMEATDVVRGLQAPPPCHHHQLHLRRAAAAIGRAVRAARRLSPRDPTQVDVVLQPLRGGFQELQWAAGALPGFEIVAFEQGCCACHPATRLAYGKETARSKEIK